MSFLWYWPAGGWDFDAWKSKQDWSPIQSDQSGKPPIDLVTDGMSLTDWQKKATSWRKISEQILGSLSDGAPTKFRYEPLGLKYTTDKYSMQRYRYSLTDEEWGYAWLMVPTDRKTSNGAVIALHQTACSGKDEPVGLQNTPDERNGVYYAQDLAQQGFVVLAPDAIAFGERQSAHRNSKYKSADEFFTAHPHGSVMLKMGFDTSRACDLLEHLTELNVKKIGCVGHSHGAYGTLFAMLADPRVAAGVISCGISCLRDDPSPDRWWRRTSLIPRLGFYADKIDQTPIDFHTWMALVAPRPVMLSGGLKDTIFPNQAALRDRIEQVRKVYALHAASDARALTLNDGLHGFTNEAKEKGFAMLQKTLS